MWCWSRAHLRPCVRVERAQGTGGPSLFPVDTRDGVAAVWLPPVLLSSSRHWCGKDRVTQKYFRGGEIQVTTEGLLLGFSEGLVHFVEGLNNWIRR